MAEKMPDGLNEILQNAGDDEASRQKAKDKIQNLISGLNPEQKKQVDSILKDKEKTQQILSTPQAQQLLKRFFKNK